MPNFFSKTNPPYWTGCNGTYITVCLAFGHIWLKNQVYTDRVGISVATKLFLGQCIKPYHKSIAQKSRCYKTATGNKCWLDKRNLHPVYPSWALWKQQYHILVRTCRSPKLTFNSVHLFDDNSWQNVCIRLKMSEKQRAEWKQRLELRWFVCLGTTVFILLGWL